MKQKDRRLTPSDLEQLVDHIQPPIKWEADACERLKDVPDIFLKRVVTGVAQRAHSHGFTTVTADFVDEFHWMN